MALMLGVCAHPRVVRFKMVRMGRISMKFPGLAHHLHDGVVLIVRFSTGYKTHLSGRQFAKDIEATM